MMKDLPWNERVFAGLCAETWARAYPDRRPWDQIGQEAREEWVRVLRIHHVVCGGLTGRRKVTAEMVQAALDAHVQYLVPTTDVNTPWREDLRRAMRGIAADIERALEGGTR